MSVFVLLRDRGTIPPPETTALGTAALRLGQQGIDVLLGTPERCFRARPGRWEPADPADATVVFDRYNLYADRPGYTRFCAALAHLPFSPGRPMTSITHHKVRFQRMAEAAGIAMPEVVDTELEAHLARWGSGFLKPVIGYRGRGVRLVHPGDDLSPTRRDPATGDWVPLMLQRAVPPPAPYAGVSGRVLVQRDLNHPEGWRATLSVVRLSRDSAVATMAGGAGVVDPIAFLGESGKAACDALAVRTTRALAAQPGGRWLARLAIDLAIDAEGRPWVIEGNSRPGGLLVQHAMALGLLDEEGRIDLSARPLRTLARLAADQASPAAEGGHLLRTLGREGSSAVID